ncbi:fungal-specific transcription factor domain-domain-containing protein [Microdochium bolleyi]|uniref:Fungal-specific transcription factor domain-domain-containing protein n=1 Tax=Microdochium bolleyi TaxID=196109 RepID=A0A136IKG2_9PEZI|nr:fungal-specific transcription factor domain-domain-containing protein [Microdochium bolleyi]
MDLGFEASAVFDSLCFDILSASPSQLALFSDTSSPAMSFTTMSSSPTSTTTTTTNATEGFVGTPETVYTSGFQIVPAIGNGCDLFQLQDAAFGFDNSDLDTMTDPQLWQDCSAVQVGTSDLPQRDPSSAASFGLLDSAIIPQAMHDPSTMLVEFWFHSVCDGWAAYDSPANPFRQLCSSLWASSAPVFYSIQSMAAASIRLDQQQHHYNLLPDQVRDALHEAPQMSTKALVHELDAFFRGPQPPDTHRLNTSSSPPAMGILVSLFCMSSSLSWIDSRQLGTQYLRHARAMLELLDLGRKTGVNTPMLSRRDRELLDFFRGCLAYEEMLRSIVSDDEEDFRTLVEDSRPAQHQQHTSSCHGPTVISRQPLKLHPWAGIPSAMSRLFGQVMVLCRRSRALWRGSTQLDYTFMRAAVGHIEQARKLEAELLAIDVRTIVDCNGGDDDDDHEDDNSGGSDPAERPHRDATRASKTQTRHHLVLAAEAFRLCGLLQLHMTFSDLAPSLGELRLCQPVAPYVGPAAVGLDGPGAPALTTSTATTTSALALHIVDIIASIPASSGMRCLQPLLCVCAGSGLESSRRPAQHRDGEHRECEKVGQLVDAPPCHINWWESFLPTPATTGPGTGLDYFSEGVASGYAPSFPVSCISANSSSGNSTSHTTVGAVPEFARGSFACDCCTGGHAGDMLSVNDDDDAKIREARAFLRNRLAELQQNLPKKPIAVACELLEEIWSTMDYCHEEVKIALPASARGASTPGIRVSSRLGAHAAGVHNGGRGAGGSVHWLDIMSTGRFQSVFG